MRLADLLQFCLQALLRARFRSVMLLLSMALGVAAVVMLTALGEGARGYVLAEFKSLGKNVLILFPGRKETTGGMPPVSGSAAREITLDEAWLLGRRLSVIEEVAPVVVGSARLGIDSRGRDATVFGTTKLFFHIQDLTLARGQPLPGGDFRRAGNEIVIGQRLWRELFDGRDPLGATVRLGDSRFRVVGVLAEGSSAMGADTRDMAFIPVAAAQRLFNVSGLFRVAIQVREGVSLARAKGLIEATMTQFHQGDLDVTVISPDAMVETLDRILGAMTAAVAAIGAISLLVAGVLIMNVMLITVSQRTREIGLLKALGAGRTEIQRLFLTEAGLLTAFGALLGVALGLLLVLLMRALFPAVPFSAPWWSVVAAVAIAGGTGLAFSWLPAHRASLLQPVDALQKP
jgi:putative ABC transport system permease protein